MKSIQIIVLAIIAALSTSVYAQTTKTYTFDDGVALETDWTVTKNVPSGANGTCSIASPSKFTAKNGNYLYFTFENKSGITLTITSTASFNSITNITFDAVANDNSKPDFTLNIVDDNGNIVKNIYSNQGSKTRFNTGGTNKWGVSNDDVSPATTGHIQLILYASSSGKYAAIDNLAVTYSAAPVVSTDATLSALTYNGTSVPNFSPTQESYEVELPAGTTTVPTVAATENESHATAIVTQATGLPGTASVSVTAEDGTTTKTYTITFTVASSAPKVTSATWTNIKGTATVDNVNMTITGQVINGTGLTAIAPQFTGNNVNSWTPTGAQNFSNGAVNYTFSSSTNETTTYAVTITEAPAVSTDATLKSLTYGGTSVPNFSPNIYAYNIELTAGLKTPPTIAAVANESHAQVSITQASSVPGVGYVDVTAEDGTTTLRYTINYTVAVPQSGLTTHVPEIYEAKDIAGGYNTPLTVFGGREYEVFYINRDNSSNLTIATSNTDKAGSICDNTQASSNTARAKDGWFTISTNGTGGDSNAGAKDEFETSIRSAKFNSSSHVLEMHIQGYDQFSFYGKDNNLDASKNKMFEVYIDNVKQTRTPSDYNINRFTLTSGEHVIRLTAVGGSDSKLCSFSFRVAQQPRTKYLKGNDSTQVVMQTAAIKPITYVTKYNNIAGAETQLEWIGQKANGISLQKIDGELTDTLLLSGTANCATGVYTYAVVAYYNGVETSRAIGKFTVKSDIQSTSDIDVEVYQGEEMDQITFKYFALSANDMKLTWSNGQPAGITGSGNNGKYIIGGTPTQTGTFPFAITVTGADTTINGKITVKTLVYGENSVLYLYKNNSAYDQDAVYSYINSLTGSNKWDLITRKAKEDGLRPAAQYANYKWVLISEDADADNPEVLAVIQGGANLPVLNLKGFTYTTDRLNWGEPNNGAIDSTATKKKGTYLHVLHADHPIYKAKLGSIKTGDSIQILSGYEANGIMPIDVKVQGSLCLGTAFTRDIENYFGAGELQTALHEVPAAMRGGHKYICLSLARRVTLSSYGKNLIDGIIAYLTSPNDSGIEAPELQINSFSIAGFQAKINQGENTITLSIPEEEYDNLEHARPLIELADPNTHVTPSAEPDIDLRYAIYIPRTFVVSDYINRRAYDLTIEVYDPQGIENIYEAGQWINIFDIYGRKVATTNEDFRTMDLPRGMYIIVTESGKTLKIMR